VANLCVFGERKDYFKRYNIEELGELYGREADLEVDLGCGDGTFILDMAEHFPERNFLAVERLLGRVRKVSKRAEKRGLTNVKVLRLESQYVVEWLLPKASVRRLHLLCPDPWPKAKHHKRRLFQYDFLKAVDGLLISEGEFLFKTDHEGYFEWAEEVMAEEIDFFERVEWKDDSFFYPKTDFQRLWESQGKSLQEMRLKKTNS